ncbi:uncharacterized protein K452DRAFT_316336 [Aplosporella prunicola CBS 121167]|uniref:Uncharacterized protein n=1 Tax=Aplosporella prunicola CBS 121167 TaxID=1176127 RepID=A0A6A6BMH2_9PEZI|nr:uncharacterized protein K452DRAFT_316336 [Aplosporella prunicola CBS 121167]KAF2145256.1 hypothetical protein K452DRAFT_316336 [Aplosporella prunicola CBS 121167]
MHAKSFTTAVVALLSSAGVLARGTSGTLTVHNDCNYTVNICEVGNDMSPLVDMEPGETKVYDTKTRIDRISGMKAGYSIKMGRPDQGYSCQSPSGITQFEYTKDADQDKIWYDWSNVNCANTDNCPFIEEGISMDSPCPNCPGWGCEAGDDYCDSVYQIPDPPRHPVYGAPDMETDLEIYLCTPGGNN